VCSAQRMHLGTKEMVSIHSDHLAGKHFTNKHILLGNNIFLRLKRKKSKEHGKVPLENSLAISYKCIPIYPTIPFLRNENLYLEPV
jgi:hypothetical protein